MEVFRGWYRKSLSRKGTVWHRVHKVDSVFASKQMAYTVCDRRIATTKCDFDMKPDHRYMQCEKSPGVIVETGRGFVPIGATAINTKADAIYELKRLLKPRTYYLRIWGIYGVQITAKWESDISIDIYTETEIITKRHKKKLMALLQVQADLGRFKSAIDCLCDATTVLAKKAKEKKKLKGRLTEAEDQAYFEELLYEAEK
ncbi:hypothetical protein LCGC14_0221080 [marine sediment metagenome]|uniref:Uncharacterized protein n=1 Tax=marine sediment metagenome TaxID=412755 RepID=A0A0F9UDH0_9ZZZZ